MSHIWRLQLLGGISARRVEGRDLRLRASRYTALLGYLALRIGQEQPRDSIIEALWPHLEVENGQHSLRKALVQLRHIFEPPGVEPESVIAATRGALRLNREAVSVDITRFAAGIKAATRPPDVHARIEAQYQIVAEYQGSLLPGIDDDWVEPYRRHFVEQYLRTVSGLIRDLEETHDLERALDVALQSACAASDRAETHLHVMQLYLALKRRREARNYWNSLVNRLERDAGYVPVEELRQFADRYGFNNDLPDVEPVFEEMRQRKPRAARRPPAVARSRTVRALPIEQVEVKAASSPVTADRRLRAAAPLPLVSTRLFGRREEIDNLADVLCPRAVHAQPHPRACVLATLIGPGGVGKTRLACEFGHIVADRFSAGVAYVPLAPVSSSAEVLRYALQTIVLEADARISSVGQIARALSGGPALLVLDNAEHVISGAAELAVQLLERLPDLRVLVTSRKPLGWRGEQVFPVAPLAVPPIVGSPEHMVEYPAIEMFLDRAQNIVPHFQLTVRNAEALVAVCQRLEGLPLSIELAAARVRAAAPAEMLKELDDRFGFLTGGKRGRAKHRVTLEATISWSVDHLPDTYKKFLLQLSVFRGGFTRDAAEAICHCKSAVAYLEFLIYNALIEVQHQDGYVRFSMLESVREFAQARLGTEELSELSARHAAYYHAVAKSKELQLRTAASSEALEALDADLSNIRAALVTTAKPNEIISFAGSMWQYWHIRNMIQEGSEILSRAVGAISDQPGEDDAVAIVGLAMMRYRSGAIQEAITLCERAMTIAQSSVSPLRLSQILSVYGVVSNATGNHAFAAKQFERCIGICKSIRDEWTLADTLNNLGRSEQLLGLLLPALGHIEEAQGIYERQGSHLNAAVCATRAASIYLRLDDAKTAVQILESILSTVEVSGNRWLTASVLNSASEGRLRLGDTIQAHKYTIQALRMRCSINDLDGVYQSLVALAKIEHRQDRLDRAKLLITAAEHRYSLSGLGIPNPNEWNYLNKVIWSDVDPNTRNRIRLICIELTLDRIIDLSIGNEHNIRKFIRAIRSDMANDQIVEMITLLEHPLPDTF